MIVKSTIKVLLPYLLIAFGLFVLFMTDFAPFAGVCILVGIVIIVERIWPEKWEADKQNI